MQIYQHVHIQLCTPMRLDEAMLNNFNVPIAAAIAIIVPRRARASDQYGYLRSGVRVIVSRWAVRFSIEE